MSQVNESSVIDVTKEVEQNETEVPRPKEAERPKTTRARGFIDCAEFDENALVVSEAKQNDKIATQLVSYFNYKYNSTSMPLVLSFDTNLIEITSYGIPKLSANIKDDDARMFIKLPLDPTQQNCLPLIDMIKRLDNWTVENKNKIFGGETLASKYEINLLAKSPPEDEEPKVNPKTGQPYPEGPKIQYLKVRLNTDYDTKRITTHIFVKKSEDPDEKPEKFCPESVTKLAEVLTWRSKVRMIITVSKFWASKTKKYPKAQSCEAGLILKVMNMVIIPNTKKSPVVDFSEYAF